MSRAAVRTAQAPTCGTLRPEQADAWRLVAAARASLAAAARGEADPLAYVRAELGRRGLLPPPDATPIQVLAQASPPAFLGLAEDPRLGDAGVDGWRAIRDPLYPEAWCVVAGPDPDEPEVWLDVATAEDPEKVAEFVATAARNERARLSARATKPRSRRRRCRTRRPPG